MPYCSDGVPVLRLCSQGERIVASTRERNGWCEISITISVNDAGALIIVTGHPTAALNGLTHCTVQIWQPLSIGVELSDRGLFVAAHRCSLSAVEPAGSLTGAPRQLSRSISGKAKPGLQRCQAYSITSM